mmetsp:Transcript_25154/g.72750  ORF Transcript_25154/g.72750 Transcript_25154/m.72750 type:complete len:212 (-) Transcript_25154:952-1587(-)
MIARFPPVPTSPSANIYRCSCTRPRAKRWTGSAMQPPRRPAAAAASTALARRRQIQSIPSPTWIPAKAGVSSRRWVRRVRLWRPSTAARPIPWLRRSPGSALNYFRCSSRLPTTRYAVEGIIRRLLLLLPKEIIISSTLLSTPETSSSKRRPRSWVTSPASARLRSLWPITLGCSRVCAESYPAPLASSLASVVSTPFGSLPTWHAMPRTW